MARILLILEAARADEAAAAFSSALETASDPAAVSCALAAPEGEAPALPDGHAPVRLVRETGAAEAVQEAWQGETWVLAGTASMRFRRDWDRLLTREAETLQTRTAVGPVITGCLPCPADVIAAVRPLAAAGFTEDGALITAPGLPLRYAYESEPAALVSPDFCFTRAAFLQEIAQTGEDPTWVAFRRRWAVSTLQAPWVTRTGPAALPVIRAPEDPELLRRFSTHFGIDFAARTLGAQAREGIWRADLSAPARVPLRIRVQERLRSIDAIASRLNPLAVTAWLTLPDAEADAELLTARFRRLCGLRNLPLACWADRAALSAAARIRPDVREFGKRLGLPTGERVTGENAAVWAGLSTPFLLAAARQSDRMRTHYVWIDADYLRYPVYERAALDWRTVCGDRIAVARVDGRADPTMYTVPEALVPMLCDDFSVLAAQSVRAGRGLPDPAAVWDELMAAHPDHYEAVDLPAPREMLSLTMPLRDEEWGSE